MEYKSNPKFTSQSQKSFISYLDIISKISMIKIFFLMIETVQN